MTTPIAILGSNSFSGNAYESHVLNSRNCLSISRSASLQVLFDSKPPNLHFENTRLVWNFNENSDSIIDVIQRSGVSIVVNFAAQSMVAESWNNPEDWYETNVVSLARFINGLRNETGIQKFIQFTTPEVYGSTTGWIKENFTFAPNTPYAISRAAGDWHLRAMYENFNFPVIFTRAANVYGKHQQLYRIIPKVILSALTGKKVPLEGGGKSIRSFINISDVNTALDRIVLDGQVGETYHISTNELISIHDLVVLICDRLNVNFSDLVEIAPDRPGKDFAYQLDSSKIRTDLNWSDKISLVEGIDETISWVVENLSELREMPMSYIHRK